MQDKVRRIKQFMEVTAEQLNSNPTDEALLGVEFSVSSAKGDLGREAAIAFIKQIEQSLAQFDPELVAQFSFNLQITHPAQDKVGKAVQERMRSIIALETNKPKLVG